MRACELDGRWVSEVKGSELGPEFVGRVVRSGSGQWNVVTGLRVPDRELPGVVVYGSGNSMRVTRESLVYFYAPELAEGAAQAVVAAEAAGAAVASVYANVEKPAPQSWRKTSVEALRSNPNSYVGAHVRGSRPEGAAKEHGTFQVYLGSGEGDAQGWRPHAKTYRNKHCLLRLEEAGFVWVDQETVGLPLVEGDNLYRSTVYSQHVGREHVGTWVVTDYRGGLLGASSEKRVLAQVESVEFKGGATILRVRESCVDVRLKYGDSVSVLA